MATAPIVEPTAAPTIVPAVPSFDPRKAEVRAAMAPAITAVTDRSNLGRSFCEGVGSVAGGRSSVGVVLIPQF